MNGLSKTLLCTCAFLINALPAIAAEELNIKGEKIGMTEDELRAMVGEPFSCGATKDLGDGVRHCGRLGTMADTYAGKHVDIMRLFRKGKLVTVYVGGLKPEDFDEVETALVDKFGKPKEDRSQVHNAFGAQFDTATDTWTTGTAILVFKKRCGKVTDSCLTLISPEYMEKEQRDKQDKARSDM